MNEIRTFPISTQQQQNPNFNIYGRVEMTTLEHGFGVSQKHLHKSPRHSVVVMSVVLGRSEVVDDISDVAVAVSVVGISVVVDAV